MEVKPKACSRTSRGSTTSPKSPSDPASPSRATPNSSSPAKAWKASKPTASSQIPLTPRSRSRRSLSLLHCQSEDVHLEWPLRMHAKRKSGAEQQQANRAGKWQGPASGLVDQIAEHEGRNDAGDAE